MSRGQAFIHLHNSIIDHWTLKRFQHHADRKAHHSGALTSKRDDLGHSNIYLNPLTTRVLWCVCLVGGVSRYLDHGAFRFLGFLVFDIGDRRPNVFHCAGTLYVAAHVREAVNLCAYYPSQNITLKPYPEVHALWGSRSLPPTRYLFCCSRETLTSRSSSTPVVDATSTLGNSIPISERSHPRQSFFFFQLNASLVRSIKAKP